MAVSGERQHTADPGAQVQAAIEHVLANRHGDWRSSPVGSQALALNYDALYTDSTVAALSYAAVRDGQIIESRKR